MKLRPYQEKAETEIHDAWEKEQSIMFQLTTGGGKTVIFVDIIKHFLKRGQRVMLVAHRQELITQAWNTLYKNKIYGGIIKGDYPTNYSLPCQVASIQTLARRSELPEADVIIFDEGHHCQIDNSYGDVMKEHYSKAKMLAVTATPYRLSGQGFGNMFDQLITSANYSDLRDDGYLVPYRYMVGSFPDLKGLKLSKGDYKDVDAAKAMGMAPLVESYIEHCNGKSGVVFAVNVQHSIKVAEQYNARGIAAAHLDGTTPDEQRKQILEDFRTHEILIIVNVGIITEGFDFPDMDFVQLARPTKSLSMFLQMVGRCFRVHDDTIRGLFTAEERMNAIANSIKPNAIILDNSGCWEEHGMPDQEFDWQMYFKGISNKQMKEAVEYIELIEFVAEDGDGNIVKTKNPKEIEGMKLVEVNKQIRQRVLNVTSIKKFDQYYQQHKFIKNIKKKGWTTFFKFRDYCKKNFIEMGPEVWDYIIKQLYHTPKDEMNQAEAYKAKTLEGIKEQYQHNPSEMRNLINGLEIQFTKKMVKAEQYFVPLRALKAERMKYESSKSYVPQMPVKV